MNKRIYKLLKSQVGIAITSLISRAFKNYILCATVRRENSPTRNEQISTWLKTQ